MLRTKRKQRLNVPIILTQSSLLITQSLLVLLLVQAAERLLSSLLELAA